MIRRIDYQGWPSTYCLSNERLELYATADVGPRIVDFRLSGAANVFYLRPDETGGTREEQWMFRGGWRLWAAPEERTLTYAPDNDPCAARVEGPNRLYLTGAPQWQAGLQKSVEITILPEQPRVSIISRLTNVGSTPLRCAAWSLSVMRPNGRALIPLDPGNPAAFASLRRLNLWSYASWQDPRYSFADNLITVNHAVVGPPSASRVNGRRADESKIGVDSPKGWAAYLDAELLYVKRFPHVTGAAYPDGGSTIEVYSSAEFLELESLSPLTTLQPGTTLAYPEEWVLMPAPSDAVDDSRVVQAIEAILDATGGQVEPA